MVVVKTVILEFCKIVKTVILEFCKIVKIVKIIKLKKFLGSRVVLRICITVLCSVVYRMFRCLIV